MDRRRFLAAAAGSATALTTLAGCFGATTDEPPADQPTPSPSTTATQTETLETTPDDGADAFVSAWGTTACDGSGTTMLSDTHRIEQSHDVYSILGSAAVAEGDDATIEDIRLDLVADSGAAWTVAQGTVPSQDAREYNNIEATRSLHVDLSGEAVGLRTSLSTRSGDDVDMAWSLVIFGGQ